MSEEKNVDIPKIDLEQKENKTGKFPRFSKRILRIAGILLLTLFLFLIIFVGLPGFNIFKKSQRIIVSAKSLKTSVEDQDLTEIRKNLTLFKNYLDDFEKSYNALSWTRIFPIVGGYWKDGKALLNAGTYGIEAFEVSLNTIEPYADIIGLKNGKEAKSGLESANDRIEFVVATVKDLVPKVDVISEKMSLVKDEIDRIDPERYPEKFRGTEIRVNLKKVISLIDETAIIITQGKPLLQAAPYLLGIDTVRTYLVLFQNDKELRPTGGFITAYSIMKVNKGKFQPVSSNDIYNLDARYKPVIPAPDPIVKYIRGPYILSKNLRLRDMNFSPDFRVAMESFTKEAEKVGIKDIDGIIAVDTHVLVKILDVIGEIGVPGYGNFSTKIISECNCPQVIHELESFADVEGPIIWDPVTGKIIYKPPHADNRKEIVGPLMNSIMSNALGQPKDKIPDLFNAALEALFEKHVLMYMHDKKIQDALESFNIAGRIRDFDRDYLLINDANLGGRKSNLYVTQEVQQEVKVGKDKIIEKTLTITYKNPQSYDGWLNSVLPNWTRIYVPKGSELMSVEGFEDKGEPYEELGKTVFSGGFKLRPQGVVKVTVKYKLPFKTNKDYKLLIQKQPGKDSPLYTINFGLQKEEFFLKTDKEIKL